MAHQVKLFALLILVSSGFNVKAEDPVVTSGSTFHPESLAHLMSNIKDEHLSPEQKGLPVATPLSEVTSKPDDSVKNPPLDKLPDHLLVNINLHASTKSAVICSSKL